MTAHHRGNTKVLSPREREVLSLFARGLSGRAIARELGIREITVRNYQERLMQKLGVHEAKDLARWVVPS